MTCKSKLSRLEKLINNLYPLEPMYWTQEVGNHLFWTVNEREVTTKEKNRCEAQNRLIVISPSKAYFYKV